MQIVVMTWAAGIVKTSYMFHTGVVVTGAAAYVPQADALDQEQRKTKIVILGTGWGATSFLNALKLKNSTASPLPGIWTWHLLQLTVPGVLCCLVCWVAHRIFHNVELLAGGPKVSCLRSPAVLCTVCVTTELLPFQVCCPMPLDHLSPRVNIAR